MAPLTRDDIVGILKPAEDTVVVQILATGATKEEFAEAYDGGPRERWLMARRFNYRRLKIHFSYTIDEAARVLGAHKHTVRSWVEAGLPVVCRQRPILISGGALRDFMSARRARSKRSCGPGQLYCLSCRSPKTPAGLMADYTPLTAKTGNLTGLCPDCDRFIHRVVSLAKNELVRGKLEVGFPQGLERIRQTTSTRPTVT